MNGVFFGREGIGRIPGFLFLLRFIVKNEVRGRYIVSSKYIISIPHGPCPRTKSCLPRGSRSKETIPHLVSSLVLLDEL